MNKLYRGYIRCRGVEAAAIVSRFLADEFDGFDLVALRQKSLSRALRGTTMHDNSRVLAAVIAQRDTYLSTLAAAHTDDANHQSRIA